MSDSIKKAIEDMQSELRKQEDQVVTTKKLINQLCAYAKMPVMYPDSELQASSGAVMVQRNSFFGRPLTTCVRDYLEMRKRNNGGTACPASLDEIFDALKEGGYDLQTISAKGPTDQKRGVSISLAKNSATFVRLPTDDFGLMEWYPNVREKRRKNGESSERTEAAETGSSDVPVETPAADETAPVATEAPAAVAEN